MSYSVNWISKVISIPTADLTLVSGTRYSLDMADFLTEARRLEWEFIDGLWAPTIVDHTNTRFDFAGVNYAPFDDLLNDYTVEFTGIATRVDLLGSNNDIIDVLIPTGVSVVPSNSAGLQIVDVGGGGAPTVNEIWDEVLTGATHNIPASAGRRLRQLGDIIAAEVVDPTPTVTTFITDLTEVTDDWYKDQLVRFTSGNLMGIVRPILNYNGTSKAITITEDLPFIPDNGSLFDIIPTHVHPMEEIADSVWDKVLP